MEPFDRVGGAQALPLARRQPSEAEQPVAGFLEAIGHRLAFEPPFADEGASTLWNEEVSADYNDMIYATSAGKGPSGPMPRPPARL